MAGKIVSTKANKIHKESDSNQYKLSPIGMIPSDWNYDKLNNVCEKFVNGGTPSRKLMEEYWEGNIPWITGADFSNQEIKSVRRYITKEAIKSSSTNLIEKGNLLVVTRTGVGKMAIAPYDVAISQDITGIYIKKKIININFLFHFLNYQSSNIRKLNQGTSISGITRDVLVDIDIPLPSLIEQKKISEIITIWDKNIVLTEKLIELKIRRKKSLMQKLISGKKRFTNYGNDWQTIKFADLSDKNKKWSITGGPFGSNLKASDYTTTGIRIVQLQNIGDGIFYDDYKIYTSKEKADELLSCNIYPGEIIISKMGDPVGRACIIPDTDERYLMASDGIRLCIDETRFDRQFVHDYINHEIFRKKVIEASSGSTRTRIGLDDLKKLLLKVPSKEEQKKIGFILSLADKEIENLNLKLRWLKEQKQGLIQILLTGKKRVRV